MKHNIIYTASLSGGKDSLAMVLRLIEEGHPLDEVVYYNSGIDFGAIVRNVERVGIICAEKGIRFVELKPDLPFLYYQTEREFVKRNGTVQKGNSWCGGVCRWGTKLKLDAIKKHEESAYKDCFVVEYVGIADDEKLRRIKKRIHGNRLKLYPLAEWGMNESDCLEYCYERGFDWVEDGIELYDVLDRVSCRYCRNKNLKELRNIYHYMPKLWDELKSLQDKTDIPYKDGKTVYDLEERFKAEDLELAPL